MIPRLPLREFACCECRRRIVVLIPGAGSDAGLCCTCVMLPGWFADPAMRLALDANHDGRDPADGVGAFTLPSNSQ